MKPKDKVTAEAFATSWNNLPAGSVYTKEQFEDWMFPVSAKEVEGKRVLEMGCGNASVLVHLLSWQPSYAEGIDLGASVTSAIKNLSATGFKNWHIQQADITTYKAGGFEIVYCIGVLHHLKEPVKGFEAVINNVKRGGRFHCWVYAKEGNTMVRLIVEPLRKIFSRFPWWFTKYFVATPAVVPFYFYAKFLNAFRNISFFRNFPLYKYSLWIAKREFSFFRHVAFDQLVTPQTAYIEKKTLEKWLAADERIIPDSSYIIMRNGNSWKFGGKIK